MNISAEEIKALKEQVETVRQIKRNLGGLLEDLDREVYMLDRQLSMMSHPSGSNFQKFPVESYSDNNVIPYYNPNKEN